MGIIEMGTRNEWLFSTLKDSFMIDIFGEKEYYPIFISTYGSLNYKLHKERLEFNILVVVSPKLKDLLTNGGTIHNKGSIYGYDVEIMDIITFMNFLTKGDLSCIEALFSPYQINCSGGLMDAKIIVEEYSDVIMKEFMIGALSDVSSNYKHIYREKKSESDSDIDYSGKDVSRVFRIYDLMSQAYDGTNLAHLNFRIENRALRELACAAEYYRLSNTLARDRSKEAAEEAANIANKFIEGHEKDEERMAEMKDDVSNLVYNAVHECLHSEEGWY